MCYRTERPLKARGEFQPPGLEIRSVRCYLILDISEVSCLKPQCCSYKWGSLCFDFS